MQHRDKAQCKQTYNDYIKKKYKRFLKKQSKETGNGNGSPPASKGLLDKSEYWITQIFYHDTNAGYLLAPSICSKIPGFTAEDGFEDKPEAITAKKENKQEKMLHDNNKKQKELYSIISTVTSNLKQKSVSTTQGTPEIVNFDYSQKRANDYKSMKKELSEDSDSDISNKTKERQKKIFRCK